MGVKKIEARGLLNILERKRVFFGITNKQTHKQADIATLWLNWHSGLIQWNYTRAFILDFFIWLVLFQLVSLHIWQSGHCTLHTVQCALRTAPAYAHESEHVHSYYRLNTVHCTPHVYTAFCKCISSHYKHQNIALVGIKFYMAKCTLNYANYLFKNEAAGTY